MISSSTKLIVTSFYYSESNYLLYFYLLYLVTFTTVDQQTWCYLNFVLKCLVVALIDFLMFFVFASFLQLVVDNNLLTWVIGPEFVTIPEKNFFQLFLLSLCTKCFRNDLSFLINHLVD